MGVAHIGLKNRTLKSTELTNHIIEIVGDSYIKLEEVNYSITELDNLKESILNDIVSFLSYENFKRSTFTINALFKTQNLVLTFNYEGLPEDLVNQLKIKYQDILLVEEVNF